MFTTTIHRLVVPPGSSFDCNGSPSNTVWLHALCFLLDQDGWFEGFWGRQLENPERVMLLGHWTSEQAAEHFLAHAYARFVDLASPILAHTPTTPEISGLDLNWAWPVAFDGAGPTTVYRNTFSNLPREQRGYSLLCGLDSYVQGLDGDGDPANKGFLGGGWAWTYDPTTGERTPTLYVAISWASLEAEACSEDNYLFEDGDRQVKILFHDLVLGRADAGGERFHVEWVDMSPRRLGRWRDAQRHQSEAGSKVVT